MSNKHPDKLNLLKSDNFPVLPIEDWYFDKLKIIQSYIKAYHTRFDLRNKTKMLVYIGAGPGLVATPADEYPLQGTPLDILASAGKFQRYLFCEKDPTYAQALKVRIGKHFPQAHTVIVAGDINQTIEKLPPYLPDKIGGSPTAILCIVDVQSFDIDFATMEVLAAMDVDLLLVNSYVHTDYYTYKFYLEEERETLNGYFGTSWARLAESGDVHSDTSFFLLVVKAYLEQLRHLGYNVTGTLHKYNLPATPVPYYQIAYCTKSKVLKSLKEKMVAEASKQIKLFD